jgi:hypothetical protein
MHHFWRKLDWPRFWAIFPQTRLVALIVSRGPTRADVFRRFFHSDPRPTGFSSLAQFWPRVAVVGKTDEEMDFKLDRDGDTEGATLYLHVI